MSSFRRTFAFSILHHSCLCFMVMVSRSGNPEIYSVRFIFSYSTFCYSTTFCPSHTLLSLFTGRDYFYLIRWDLQSHLKVHRYVLFTTVNDPPFRQALTLKNLYYYVGCGSWKSSLILAEKTRQQLQSIVSTATSLFSKS